MKKLLPLLALPFFLSLTTGKLPALFLELIERNEMQFEEPEGLKQTKPIDNYQMGYELAYKDKKKRFEVRYAIRPYDSLLASYYKRQADTADGSVSIHPDNLARSIFIATMLNVSDQQLREYTDFDSEAVKAEFNADRGSTAFVPAGEEFGQDYKWVLYVYLHKDGVGDAHIFYLGDDPEVIQAEMLPIFHNLRFKP